MRGNKSRQRLLLPLLSLALVAPATLGQQQLPPQKTQTQSLPPVTETAEVVRVETELVQTAISVIDKKAQFVEGLRRDQFEMRIDGKSQPISFFEQVDMGSASERQQVATARGDALAPVEPAASGRGMTVFLFVDDLRLDSSSYVHVRQSLLHYIENVMGENDQAAIASTGGQIGFLQQLTDNKAVLRQAVSRLGFRDPGKDQTRPPISVYQAFAVQEDDDEQTKSFLIRETMHEHHTDTDPVIRRVGLIEAAADVSTRTRAIVEREGLINKATFSTLENLLRRSAQLPGRKIVFFFSSGFMLQTKSGDDRERMSRIVDAAARADAVIYTVDVRGLATDPMFSADRAGASDPYGLSTRSSMSIGELPASQQGLLTLAGDTGGRAILNTNGLDAGINRALDESSRYYLLAWRPETEANRGGKFRRIEVTIAGRPDLTVRLHRGYYSPSSQTAAKTGKAPAAVTPQAELNAAIVAPYPRTELPALLVAHYTGSVDAGATLTASVGVSSESLSFKDADGGRAVAAVDLACVVVDDNGKQVRNSSTQMNVSTRASIAAGGVPRRDVMQDFQFTDLKPGLYQVRAAARDAGSGRIGGVARWIEIPDLTNGQLIVGTVIIGELPGVKPNSDPGAMLAPVSVSAGRPLARGSRLHFSTDVYNATRAEGLPPNVTVRAVVLGGGRTFADTGEREVMTDGLNDLTRLPYSDEINLEALTAGLYLLKVSATDRRVGKSVTQLAKFSVR
jgi:VWFA-related protein